MVGQYLVSIHRTLAGMPLSRWPLSWHVGIALVCLFVAGVAALLWERHLVTRHAQVLAQYRQIEAEFQRLQQAGGHAPAQPMLPLAEAGQLDRVVRDIGQFADARAVRVVSLKIEHMGNTGAAAGDVPQVRLALQAAGSYTSLKSWLAELLARYPALALHSLSLHAGTNAQQQVEAAVSFALFLKVSP